MDVVIQQNTTAHRKRGYGYEYGSNCGLWHLCPSVQWHQPVRLSTSGITSGKVISTAGALVVVTVFNSVQQCSTLFNSVQQCSTVIARCYLHLRWYFVHNTNHHHHHRVTDFGGWTVGRSTGGCLLLPQNSPDFIILNQIIVTIVVCWQLLLYSGIFHWWQFLSSSQCNRCIYQRLQQLNKYSVQLIFVPVS